MSVGFIKYWFFVLYSIELGLINILFGHEKPNTRFKDLNTSLYIQKIYLYTKFYVYVYISLSHFYITSLKGLKFLIYIKNQKKLHNYYSSIVKIIYQSYENHDQVIDY